MCLTPFPSFRLLSIPVIYQSCLTILGSFGLGQLITSATPNDLILIFNHFSGAHFSVSLMDYDKAIIITNARNADRWNTPLFKSIVLLSNIGQIPLKNEY
jgi:hypothetical protein